MEIVGFEEKHRQDFIRLNTAWIEKYFTAEDEDRQIFEHIDDELNEEKELSEDMICYRADLQNARSALDKLIHTIYRLSAENDVSEERREFYEMLDWARKQAAEF